MKNYIDYEITERDEHLVTINATINSKKKIKHDELLRILENEIHEATDLDMQDICIDWDSELKCDVYYIELTGTYVYY